MPRPHLLILAVYSALALLALPGCGSSDSTAKDELIAPQELTFDPTHTYTLAEWWSNGHQLLHLRPDGGYRIYPEVNRYRPAIEVGQWRQRNYATLEFMPYKLYGRERLRVQLDRPNGDEFLLRMRSYRPMVNIDAPPLVLEDRLVGRWQSDAAELILHPDGTYVYDEQPPANESTSVLTGHSGQWMVDDETLVLDPIAPGLPTSRIPIDDPDDGVAQLAGLRKQ